MGFYWEAVCLSVCRRCIDGDSTGNCHLPAGDVCALEEFFPEIVCTVSAVQSALLEDHVKAVREEICSRCFYQLPNGFCPKRKKQMCTLDRFFPVVVETIETIQHSLQRAQ